MINEFLDSVQQRITDAFAGFWDLAFIAGLYGAGFAIFVSALALTWFFGGLPVVGKWIRGLGGVAVLLYGAFLAGITVMYRHNKEEREAARAKLRELQAKQQKQSGGWFS